MFMNTLYIFLLIRQILDIHVYWLDSVEDTLRSQSLTQGPKKTKQRNEIGTIARQRRTSELDREMLIAIDSATWLIKTARIRTLTLNDKMPDNKGRQSAIASSLNNNLRICIKRMILFMFME